ncbi:alkaline phosphatase family protein [Flavobacterium sp. Arc2]|uniref:alkaline phosphatase family protein n=1 Tax=Flavobacterium sp. Arc2 TaxID=3046685 RepID=UPI00352DFA50
MKKVIVGLVVMLSISLHAQGAKTDKGVNKVVMILVDGIATDQFYKANTSSIDAMTKTGAFSEAYVGGRKGGYSETPTISAVGYNSMLTGTWSNKHNVLDNAIAQPNYNYPTIFRVLKDAYPNKKTAIYSSWLDNRTKLVGEGLPQTNNMQMDYHFDGLELDKKRFPHDSLNKYLKRIDAEVAREAANNIYETGPDLSWVYLEHSDDMGHIYGDSPELYSTIAYEDALIGLIADAVKLREKETGEHWLVIVTTDHGRMPADGKHHGGQSYRERSTWIAMNKPTTNDYFKNNTVAIVDIFPTICDFMDIPLPDETAYELDGVSLTKKVDIYDLEGFCFNEKFLKLKWLTTANESEKAKILVSYTNGKKEGKKDTYTLLGETDIQNKEFNGTVKPNKAFKYMKIVMQTKNQITNTWVKIN